MVRARGRGVVGLEGLVGLVGLVGSGVALPTFSHYAVHC